MQDPNNAKTIGVTVVSHPPSERPLMTDLVRGLLGRCPCCGKGRMFGAYLKVNDRCAVCGEELFHHRADDFPAYIVIFIVGHLLVPTALSVETHFAPPYWVHLALWLPAAVILTLGLLQPTKGVIVALQWRLGMHGFEHARQVRSERGWCGGFEAPTILAASPVRNSSAPMQP
jgi:uncharacterized protein (DUF983 family)